ncbi:MAG: flagellar motor switch protein FliN [Epulopiscium sp.]|jgi:flagellar motor switch protein FliN/FliY|nr:flagellar motor switch protein FliN [Candidatus Epulonipiscium sp.]HHW67365.1 flagellar motor switch phosphatase FliY [Candidatus Epulonipiscium sp.]
MGDMLSQAEIDALLGGTDADLSESNDAYGIVKDILTDDEKDALGEIGNISMGTAATTLFTLLNQKVTITTPKVKVVTWSELSTEYVKPFVAINVEYKEGLKGSNLLILKEDDVKVIADLMMGGDGTNVQGELTELHLSAISEAMNQMVGSAATSMSSMFNKKIDINPPHAFVVNLQDGNMVDSFGFGEEGVVRIAFKMEIGNLIDSEIMQILPVDFAKDLVRNLIHSEEKQSQQPKNVEQPVNSNSGTTPIQQEGMMFNNPQPNLSYGQYAQYTQPNNMGYQIPPTQQPQMMPQNSYQQSVNVHPAEFQSFDVAAVMRQKENIDIIMDVPLEVTVELGRTHKLIKEILEFSPGTIIELDKLAGEPIDILVNGKFVAKGEVVVIDENFGIRITEITNPENRI